MGKTTELRTDLVFLLLFPFKTNPTCQLIDFVSHHLLWFSTRNICGQSKWSEMGVVSSQLPSLFLAGVPGTLQLPRQGHSWQWISDCPNTFLGSRDYILHLCWGLGVAEDCIHRSTGEKFKLQKQSSLFWMHFLTELSGATDTTLNPLSLLSLCSAMTELIFPSPSVLHLATKNDEFHFIC